MTDKPVQVGRPGAPGIGPVTFHPYPYQVGLPTKMIIRAEQTFSRPATLRGFRCVDGRALRFLYTYGQVSLPKPPYTEQQLEAKLGAPVVNLRPMKAGGTLGGYALFSASGRWLITIDIQDRVLGALRIDVVPCRTTGGGSGTCIR